MRVSLPGYLILLFSLFYFPLSAQASYSPNFSGCGSGCFEAPMSEQTKDTYNCYPDYGNINCVDAGVISPCSNNSVSKNRIRTCAMTHQLCAPGDIYNAVTGMCDLPPSTPSECQETGQYFDSRAEGCVDTCPGGSLDSYCLETTLADCTAESSDYQGTLNGVPRCSGDSICEPGETFGFVNDEQVCIPDEYGPPSCSGNAQLVMDQYGYKCEYITDPEQYAANDQDEDGIADYEDSDITGDGQPNTDQELMASNLETNTKILEGQGVTNDSLAGIEGQLAKLNSTADDIASNMGNDGEPNPDDPIDRGLLSAPTIDETNTRLSTVFFGNAWVSYVSDVPTLATSGTCPTWTIPATPYWSPIPFDAHCGMIAQHYTLLSTIFTAMWALAAVLVFLRA